MFGTTVIRVFLTVLPDKIVTIGRFAAFPSSSCASECGRLTRKKQIYSVAAHDETVNRFSRIDSSFDDAEKACDTKSKYRRLSTTLFAGIS
jgi:hypothetical protein